MHYNLEVTGRVQGVGFRYSAQNEACRLGVNGFVKNRPDGTVYMEVEGNAVQLNAMIRWCRTGPRMSRVESVREWSGEVVGYKSFSVR